MTISNTYLINKNFKATRRGEFVSASKDSGEFILNLGDETNAPSTGTLIEIEKANNLNILAKFKKNKSDFLSELSNQLGEVKMPEQNEMTLEDKADKIIKDLIEQGKGTEEHIILALLNAKIPFKPANRIMKRKLSELGVVLSPKERLDKATVILEDRNFKPKSHEDVLAAVAKLSEDQKDGTRLCNEKQALGIIRKFCKMKNIDMPKKVKGAGNLRAKIFSYMIGNPSATFEQFKKFMEENNRAESAIKRSWEIFEVAQKMADTLNGKTPAPKAKS